MQIELTSDLTGIDWAELAEVFRRAPLGPRDPLRLERAFRGSYLCCIARDGQRLVGAGRAISDGEAGSTIFDVVVLPEYQRRGIGRAMMEFLLNRLPPGTVVLIAAPGKEDFYRKLDFRRLRTAFALYANPDSQMARGYIE